MLKENSAEQEETNPRFSGQEPWLIPSFQTKTRRTLSNPDLSPGIKAMFYKFIYFIGTCLCLHEFMGVQVPDKIRGGI